MILIIVENLTNGSLPLRTFLFNVFDHLLLRLEILVEPLELLPDDLLELELFLIEDFSPLLKLHTDQILHALFFLLQDAVVPHTELLIAEGFSLLVNLLPHLHEDLHSHGDFVHGLALFSDVMAFVGSEKSAGVTTFLLARDADELPGLTVLEAHRDLLNRGGLHPFHVQAEGFVDFLDRRVLLLTLQDLVREPSDLLHVEALWGVTFTTASFFLNTLLKRRIPKVINNTTLELDPEHIEAVITVVSAANVWLPQFFAAVAVVLGDYWGDRLESVVNGVGRVGLNVVVYWCHRIPTMTPNLMLAPDLTVVFLRRRERIR